MRHAWIALLLAAAPAAAHILGAAAPAAAQGALTNPAPVAPQAIPPAQAPESKPPPTTPPSSERFVFVPSGVDRTVNFVAQLLPDCTSMGSTEYRVEAKPGHGAVSFQQGENFSSYPMNSPMQRCNDKKAPGLFTHYKSDEGYVGEDHVDVLYLMPSATAFLIRYTVIVK